MKIVHHSKTVGFGGTDKSAQLLCTELNKIDGCEAYLMYQANGDRSRLEEARSAIGIDKVIPYHHKHANSPPSPYWPAEDNFKEVLDSINPDIVHIHRSGYREWPALDSVIDAKYTVVETNIFGEVEYSGFFDSKVYISEFIRQRAVQRGNANGPVIRNPCLPPIGKKMPSDGNIYLGRIGRADNFSPISLEAMKILDDPRVHYLVVNPCDGWRKTVKKLKLRNVHFLGPIISDTALSEFYHRLDIYAHARSDGECQPCNLNEAMYHGVPVVTHPGHTYHGNIEQVDNAYGRNMVSGNPEHYAAVLSALISDQDFYKTISEKGVKWAKENVDSRMVAKMWHEHYSEILHG